jgi:integrase
MNRHLLPRFGNKRIGDITTAMVENMRAELRSEGLSSQTVQRITSLLAGTFKFAQKSDPNLDLPTNRLSRVKFQNQEVIPFTQEETAALLDVGCVQYDTVTRGNRKGEKTVNEYKTQESRVIVGLALFAGLRASEALGLDWRHVDFEKGTIHIRQVAKEGQLRDSTKSYKTRTVPISKSLKPLLENLFVAHQSKGREDGLVLSRVGSKPYNQIQAMFGRIRGKIGLDVGQGYHTLRHTFATRAAENNVDIPTLQKLLGHSSVTVTMKYVHTTEAHLDASAKKLD